MAVPITLYETLEVSQRASAEVIKAAYRVLVNKYHPDRHPGDKEAAEKCALINKAYDTLSDAIKKKEYDATLQPPAYSQPMYSQQSSNIRPTYKSWRPPQPPPPPPPPPKPDYVFDPKWEKFLAERPDWAKTIVPPVGSWAETDVPVRQLPGGFTDVRPDLEVWCRQLIHAGRSADVTFRAIEQEIVRTWEYSADGCGSLTRSLIREAVSDRVRTAQGIHPHSKVQFGV